MVASPPDLRVAWLPASWTLALLSCALAVTSFVSRHVPEAYMDEPFHVPMAQRYCAWDLASWDPKVTTFPGLYVLGAAYAQLSSLLLARVTSGGGLDTTCSGPFLRSLNALLAVACIQLAYAVSVELQRAQQHSSSSSSSSSMSSSSRSSKGSAAQQRQRQQAAEQQAAGVALVVGLLPTQAFFAFLFYTDIGSLLFLLATELLLLRGATWNAAAAGAAAIGMRQTNAVWVAFLTGAAMLQQLLQGTGPAQNGRSSKQRQQQCWSGPGGAAAAELAQLLQQAWQQRGALAGRFWPLLALPGAFCVFVVVNGGITLGDKEAHAPSAHLMQPLYFAAFCLATAAPLLLQPSIARRAWAGATARPALALAGLALALAAGVAIVARYSLEHPYVLADNRHYTFYLWRKVIKRHWAARYCLVPAYVGGWLLLLSGLSATQHWLWVAAYVASTCVTLVPAWLLEFRYFTVPFALAVLHLPPPPRALSLAVAAAYCAVNAATLAVFALRPYTWGDGTVARFMW